jgi:hypothetical protein
MAWFSSFRSVSSFPYSESIGFDYSISTGDLTLTPNLLTTALQQQLGAQLAQLIKAGVIPPTYMLGRVPRANAISCLTTPPLGVARKAR